MRTVYNINVFGVVAVTKAMLPLLRKSQAGRIVNVSSGLGSMTQANDRNSEFFQVNNLPYQSSKAALNAITVEFTKELAETPIKVNAADPGFTISAPDPASARIRPWYTRTIDPFMKIGSNIMTTTRAARSSIYIASSPALTGISGKYFTTARKAVKSSQASYDEVAAQKLWQACMQLTGLAQYESSPM